MPALTPEEARQALDGIDQAARQMRRALGAGRMGSNFILWGPIWIAAFTFGHFHPAQAGRAWLVLGASVAAGALLGRLLVPPGLFQLWMALCGGGGLLGAGLYVRLRWR